MQGNHKNVQTSIHKYIMFLGHSWLECNSYALFPSNGTISDPLRPGFFLATTYILS